MPKEITGEPVGEVRAVSDMHQREGEMARRAYAFISLPGGYGTLEELVELITRVQLEIHRKSVGLFNVDGYYNQLTFIDKTVGKGFVSRKAHCIIVSAPTAKELVRKLEVALNSAYTDAIAQGLNEQKADATTIQNVLGESSRLFSVLSTQKTTNSPARKRRNSSAQHSELKGVKLELKQEQEQERDARWVLEDTQHNSGELLKRLVASNPMVEERR